MNKCLKVSKRGRDAAQLEESCSAWIKAQGLSAAPHKPGVVEHVWNIWEVGIGEPEVNGHLQVHSQSKARLHSMRLCLKWMDEDAQEVKQGCFTRTFLLLTREPADPMATCAHVCEMWPPTLLLLWAHDPQASQSVSLLVSWNWNSNTRGQIKLKNGCQG